RIMVDQVRQGVLAEQLGYDFYFMTEHHFQPEGPEFSPNPLMAEMAIAAQTRRIRLGQATNILTQWHPLRVAELGAMLDVISGGRVEFGVGRGYQPREVEVLGFPYGASIQDQERNWAYFQEASAHPSPAAKATPGRSPRRAARVRSRAVTCASSRTM